jgi:hypothetical protein
MSETTNTLSIETLREMNKHKSEMDYLEWARVIDSLETAIADSKKSIEINIQFLKAAIIQQSKHPAPEKKDNTV